MHTECIYNMLYIDSIVFIFQIISTSKYGDTWKEAYSPK